MFFVAFFIVSLACSTISIKTLIGYSDIKLIYKIIIGAFIVLGWFGIFIIKLLKLEDILSTSMYSVISTALYTLMGFVLILFVVLMLRDVVWYALYYSLKLFKIDTLSLDPQNLSMLNKANLIVVFVAILTSGYAVYEGTKIPNIINERVYSNKLSRNLRIVQLSDLHITRSTSDNRILSIINMVNSLNPDVIVLTGDTIDDNIEKTKDKIALLSNFSAPFGVYAIMGNHEFYNDVYAAKKMLEQNNIKFLFNGGVFVANSNIYVTGIPDFTTMFDRINLWRSVKDTKKDDFRVLLSHQPLIINSINKDLYDIVLSGHTHGGQIFPMHFFAKKANQYLAGRYSVNGIELFVSRGAGDWGPPMRLFAPSDIMVIDLLKK